MSRFWRVWIDKTNVQLRPSSADHPRTDGQTDVMNKKIEEIWRCFAYNNQTIWDAFLTDVEVAYNHSVNSVTTLVRYNREPGLNIRTDSPGKGPNFTRLTCECRNPRVEIGLELPGPLLLIFASRFV